MQTPARYKSGRSLCYHGAGRYGITKKFEGATPALIRSLEYGGGVFYFSLETNEGGVITLTFSILYTDTTRFCDALGRHVGQSGTPRNMFEIGSRIKKLMNDALREL